MSGKILYLIIVAIFFYIATRNPRCPYCGKRMKEKYEASSGISYNQCPRCGYINITDQEDEE